MTLIELTLATQDELDGTKILIHKDDVRKAMPFKMNKDKVPDLMSGAVARRDVTLLYVQGVGGGATVVTEDMQEVQKLINGEVK